ncbi:MAG: phosphatase PAP2 family protein, partial [Bdellovibrionales bacterium]|nr:phosphatase PAP2 family protein [Bdellovibrionales bacterium]
IAMIRLDGVKSLALHKLTVFLLYACCYALFYLYPNLYPVWEPQFLPMLAIDRATPLVPWTFLIYTSDYLLILTVILWTSREEFNHFARMAFMVLFFCGVFFYLMPTTYPRPEYPNVSSAIVRAAMWLVSAADSPANCFPSQHVALTSICAWSMRRRGSVLHAFYWLWALAIFASTLTTKQHYFCDILGGLVVAVCVTALEYFYCRKAFVLTAKVPVK